MDSLYLLLIVFCVLFHTSNSAYIGPATLMQPANLGNGALPLQVIGQYPECFPVAIIGSRLAESRDCLIAVMMLPTSDDSGEFHSDSRATPNQFFLPLSKIHGTCNVTVSIEQGLRDQCSWSTISMVADQLARACSAGYYPNGKSGGITVAGKRSQIRISMGKIGHILSELNTTTSSGSNATS
ncbi:hypothetical protein ACLMJK_005167 [Lecanora helva]